MHPEDHGTLCGHLQVEGAGIWPNSTRVLYPVTSDKKCMLPEKTAKGQICFTLG